MLDKFIDILIIGENYLSYLMAYSYLKRDKSVLILNPPMQIMNHSHFKEISAIEYAFIKSWYSQNLKNEKLDLFLTQKPFLFKLDDTELLLGTSSPSTNIVELSRKCHDILPYYVIGDVIDELGVDEFDHRVNEFSKRLGESLFKYHSLQNFSMDLLTKDCPHFLLNIFEVFLSNIEKHTKENKFNNSDLLVYALRSKFQSTATHKYTKEELFHLFLRIITPHYYLNESEILTDLKNEFIKIGGFYREANVQSIKYDKGKPWCAQLDSFEGIVHPRRMVFIGGGPKELPVKVKNPDYFIEVNASLESPYKYFKNMEIFHFHSKLMGTDYSMWSYLKSDKNLKINFMTKYFDALKESFIKDEFEKIIQKRFGFKDSKLDHLKFGHNISSFNDNYSISSIKPLHVVDRHPLGSKFSSLVNVDGLGALKNTGLGPLSTLMEAKDYHLFYS